MAFVGQKISTSTDIFKHIIEEKLLYVDKSLWIADIIEDGNQVMLITRPRRFGKTLNMSMLHCFFASEVMGQPTKGLFDQLQIAHIEKGKYLKAYQGQYPVIFITLKDIKEFSFEAAINSLRLLMMKIFRQHTPILSSNKLDDSDKQLFHTYVKGEVDDQTLTDSLKVLSELLYRVHEKKVMILIDEYDTPLNTGYEYDFLDLLSNFMRNFLSGALKSNPCLYKGIMTGILRVSKNNMLSGLNNLKVYTLFDEQYGQYFGFKESEVKELLHFKKMDGELQKVRQFYNGYKIGKEVLYNPWSVMNYLHDVQLRPYWVLTANDGMLKKLLIHNSDEYTKQQLEDLMQGKAIQGTINPNLNYAELFDSPDALWTLLLFCGYLKAKTAEIKGSKYACDLMIPNHEVLIQYTEIFSDWLKEKMGSSTYDSFLKHLIQGKVDAFMQDLGEFLMRSLSFRDVVGDKKGEIFYHGFFAGLTASLQDTHHYTSNRESSLGVYDVMLIPKDEKNTLGIILEFKHAKQDMDMQKEANNALDQIEALHYDMELMKYPYVCSRIESGLSILQQIGGICL